LPTQPTTLPPLRIWAVSDGRAGIENQVLGLAEAVARLTAAEVVRKRIAYRGLVGRLPQVLNLAPRAALSSGSDPIEPPWPDLWIAAGRATLPLSAGVRRWSEGKTFVVQLQDPGWSAERFDLVIPPEHDGLTGANVFPILGSPHRATPERLASAYETFRSRLESLPSPRFAALVGGKSHAHDLPPDLAAAFAEELGGAVESGEGSLLVTFSRRTPAEARRIITERLSSRPAWIWNGEGPNPYFAFLAAADAIVVTADSTNMAVEAASTGKPVLVRDLQGSSPKHEATSPRAGGPRRRPPFRPNPRSLELRAPARDRAGCGRGAAPVG
jgi:mitochondrial fission protein ELM1